MGGKVEDTNEYQSHVWMGSNEVNCSSVQLPDGAQCLEAECNADYLFWIGDGFCNKRSINRGAIGISETHRGLQHGTDQHDLE